MKRILFIHQTLEAGGAEKVLIDILNNFNYLEYQVSLLIMNYKGVYCNQINTNCRLNVLLKDYEQRLLGYLRKCHMTKIVNYYLRFKIRRLFKNQYYDTVISFMEGIPMLSHGYILDKADRHITWVHTDLVQNDWCKSVYSSQQQREDIYSRMHEVVVVSEGAKQSFIKLFPLLSPKVIVNLIDKPQIIEKSNASKYSFKKFTVCSIGRLCQSKRHDRIVEVADLCKQHKMDIDFIIIGKGPLHDYLQDLIQKKNVEDAVHLLGFKANPYPYLAASDIFLITSDAEGYPLVVCEALCLGKPIVSTDVTGPHELLEDNVGVLTELDSLAIFNAVRAIYLNQERRLFYSSQALQKSRCFDVDTQMNAIYNLIQNV